MPTSRLALETSAITSIRLALFYFCRTYVLRSLYHDLRVLSSQSLSPHASSNLGGDLADGPLSALDTPVEAIPLHVSALGGRTPELSDAESADLSLPSPSSTPRRRSTSAASTAFAWAAGSNVRKPEENVQLTLARTAFALCFSESCILFIMVMCQVAQIFSARARKLNWDISLTVLICLVLLLIPLLQCSFITSRRGESILGSGRWVQRCLFILIPYTIYLFGVYRIPIPEGLASSGFMSTSLARLTVIGVFFLGLISGYGSISTAAMFFADMARSDWVEPTKQDIIQAEQSLYRIRSDLLQRKTELAKRASDGANADAGSSSGWFSRLSYVWNGSDPESTSIQREIQGLEILEGEMARDLKELHIRKARIRFSRTLKGKLWKWIGWAFGLYCAFRVISSLLNLFLPHRFLNPAPSSGSRTPDLITLGLVYIMSHLPLPASLSFLRITSKEQIAAVSRQISLVLVGCIVLVSVRGMLRGVGWILRRVSGAGKQDVGIPRSAGPKAGGTSRRTLVANVMLLLLAQIMGLYFLSTLIQLRNSFPPNLPPPTSIEEDNIRDKPLFASLPSYEVFNSLFDWAFLVSAGCTAGGQWIRRKIGM